MLLFPEGIKIFFQINFRLASEHIFSFTILYKLSAAPRPTLAWCTATITSLAAAGGCGDVTKTGRALEEADGEPETVRFVLNLL